MRKNVLGALLAGTIESAPITGCSAASSGTVRSSVPQQTQELVPVFDEAGTSTADTADLIGHTLMTYCGADTIRPFQGIADSSRPTAGCEMNVTYVNASQIQSQITTSEESDMFIAGLAEELKPAESYVSGSRALIKHIPVLVIQSGNPKNITSLSGLAAKGVFLIIGDASPTPIGEITKKALSDAGILDKVQTAAPTVTAPRMATAIVTGEVDAAIIQEGNCDAESVEIVNNSGLKDYIETIPTASLICSADHDARQVFPDYLNSGEARETWIVYGYEIAG